MADTKTSALTALAACDMSNDYMLMLDVSASELKKITPDDFLDSDSGTWTMVLSDGVNNATMSLTTGSYEKQGRQVTIRGYITTTSLGSVSGSLRITGLPFTAQNFTAVAVGYGSDLAITPGSSVGGYIQQSATYINLTVWDIAGGASTMQESEWTANGKIMFACTYQIA